eukprot:TRINITY_DN2261_c0_g1_i6.p1 TRINITY_DN2261_c0_g1~~TRINITY_DN2261_c0_g1_i6.p1  ORF type:complete len:543 (+),score=117.34 TRINITY_DN2261_c0_g1_i6:77-1705(+)
MWVEDEVTPHNGSPEPEPNADPAPEPVQGEQVEAESLTCPLCLDLFNEPVILNCGHTVCAECVSSVGGGCFVCPVCREAYRGLEPRTLPIHPKVKQSLAAISAPPKPQQITCDKCEVSAARLACETCDVVLCDECNTEHHKGKLKLHHLIDAESFSLHSIPFCTKPGHSRYRTDVVCSDSGEMMCLLCFQVDPALKNKKCQPVGEALVKSKKTVADFIVKAEGSRTALKTSILQIDTLLSGISDLYNEEISKLRGEFQHLREEIDKRELLLIEQASRSKEKQTSHLADVRARTGRSVAMLNVDIAKAEKAHTMCDLKEIKKTVSEGRLNLEKSQNGLKIPHFSKPVLRVNKGIYAHIKNLAGFEYEHAASESSSEVISVSPRSATTPRSRAHLFQSSEESDTMSPAYRRKRSHNTTPLGKQLNGNPTPRRSTPPRKVNGSGVVPGVRRTLSRERQAIGRHNSNQTTGQLRRAQSRDRDAMRRTVTDASTTTPEKHEDPKEGEGAVLRTNGVHSTLYASQYQQRNAHMKSKKEADLREEGWRR